MRNALTAAAVLLIGTTAASAESMNTTCTRGHRTSSCFTNFNSDMNNDARVIRLAPMSDEGAEQDAKWLRYCQPTKHADSLGVIRLEYAHAGCEFGRTE